MKAFGYRIRNRSRGDFEIEGVSEELCKRFSKRDAEIDAALAKLLAEHPELGGGNISELRAQLATEKRTRKQKDMSRDELRTIWDAQLNESERAVLRQLAKQQNPAAQEPKQVTVAEAVQWAEEHLFDRNSVVLECQVWQEALGRARGENFSVSELTDLTRQRGYIRDAERPGEVTLRDVLLREWEIVQTAKEGVGDAWPLVANPRPANPKLDDEQRRALDALLSSINLVSRISWRRWHGQEFCPARTGRTTSTSLAGTLSFLRRSVSKSWQWKRRGFRPHPRSPVSSSSANWLNARSSSWTKRGKSEDGKCSN